MIRYNKNIRITMSVSPGGMSSEEQLLEAADFEFQGVRADLKAIWRHNNGTEGKWSLPWDSVKLARSERFWNWMLRHPRAAAVLIVAFASTVGVIGGLLTQHLIDLARSSP